MRLTRYGPYLPALACSLVLATGCSYQRGDSVDDTIYERASFDLAQAPEPAATCLVRNARDAGLFASPTPLYGTMSMGVTVRTTATDDTLATINLVPSARGSQAAVIRLRSGSRLDQARLESILKGC